MPLTSVNLDDLSIGLHQPGCSVAIATVSPSYPTDFDKKTARLRRGFYLSFTAQEDRSAKPARKLVNGGRNLGSFCQMMLNDFPRFVSLFDRLLCASSGRIRVFVTAITAPARPTSNVAVGSYLALGDGRLCEH